jgi:GAF domain-containing protein
MILHRNDFPLYFDALESSPFILAIDACEHPETKEFKEIYLKPLGIFSMLDCPIVIDGKPVGVICCEHQQAFKEWSTEDVLYIQSLSGHISIFYKNLEINDLLNQIRNRNFELVEKSNEIETMNEELSALNEELSTLNETLEATVRRRTSELETQNKQLTEYAFINSHILRAPLARILGLAQLFSIESTSPKDKQLLDALIRSSDELDIIIRKISDILYDGNNLSREDIQGIIDRTIYKN